MTGRDGGLGGRSQSFGFLKKKAERQKRVRSHKKMKMKQSSKSTVITAIVVQKLSPSLRLISKLTPAEKELLQSENR